MNRSSYAAAVAALVASVFLACELAPTPDSATQSERGTSPLEATFEEAARAYQVPVELLKAMGHVESRFHPTGGRSLIGGWGPMQLVERGDWNMLQRAHELTGASLETLRVDERANIFGAAAVLRSLADQSFSRSSAVPPLPNPPPAGGGDFVSDFYRAVSVYPGHSSPSAAAEYAAEVFLTLERGFVVQRADGTVSQVPLLTDWRRHAPIAVHRDALKEYPNAFQWKASPNFSTGRTSYEFVIIHTIQGSYSGAISWFLNTNSNVSSHYVVRSSDGQVTQMVEHADTAWHAQCYNSRAVAIEHEGFVEAPGTWYTEAMYTESAKLTRWIADRHNIPLDRSHIIGHNEVAPSCNTNGHTDPGAGWNWTKYMGLVLGTSATGKLSGVVYEGGNLSQVVAGAKVSASGQSVVTGADGKYELVLNPGLHNVTATKSGYGTASDSDSVTAGGNTFVSLEINPVSATGRLRGKVYEYNPSNPSDTSQAIVGATVAVTGQSQSSDGSGMYDFTLAPGMYSIQVSKTGYATQTIARTVSANATVWGSTALSTSTSADQQPPSLALTAPAAGAKLDVASVWVRGTASDDRGAVSAVQLVLNGTSLGNVPVTAGVFAKQVKLAAGLNTLAVNATDAAGNVGNATVQATFNAGVYGFVHATGDPSSRIGLARIELLKSSNGELVASTDTAHDGTFALSVTEVPKDYILVAKASGYLTVPQTVTIPDDQRLGIELPLQPGEDPPVTNIEITFETPAQGAVVKTETVAVTGAVVGLDPIAVEINGVAAELGASGTFTATVSLVLGENQLRTVARGTKGESITKTLTVIRELEKLPVISNQLQVDGGCHCGSTPAGGTLAFLTLLAALRRRRLTGKNEARRLRHQ